MRCAQEDDDKKDRKGRDKEKEKEKDKDKDKEREREKDKDKKKDKEKAPSCEMCTGGTMAVSGELCESPCCLRNANANVPEAVTVTARSRATEAMAVTWLQKQFSQVLKF